MSSEQGDENLSEVQQVLKSLGFLYAQYNKCASFTDIENALEFIENDMDNANDFEVIKEEVNQEIDNNADNERESDNSKDIDSDGERGEISNDDGAIDAEEMEVQNFQDEEEHENEVVSATIQEAEKGLRFERVTRPETERSAGQALGSHRDYSSSDHDLYLAIENSINDQRPSKIQYEKRNEGIPVGLMRSQTPYLNPLIQAIYNISSLRDSLMEVPTDNDLPSFHIQNVLIEFQYLLGLLHFSERRYVESTPLVNKIVQVGRYIDLNARNNPIELLNALLEKVSNSVDLIIEDINAKEEKKKNQLNNSDDEKKRKEAEAIAEIQQMFQNLTLTPIINPIKHYLESEITQTSFSDNNEENIKKELITFINVNPKQGELFASLIDYSITEKQNSFFSKLPEILIINIDRVIKFVGDRNINESLFDHQAFTFPKVLYLDRFLESNRKETLNRQSVIKELKSQQDDLKTNLRKYSHYNENSIGIDQLLKGSIQFLNDSKNKLILNQDDYSDEEYFNSIKQFNDVIEQLSNEFDSVSEEMMSYVDCIDQLQQSIDTKFEDMTEVQYHLYAILVHEGPADMGSSWAFIYNINQEKWYKFYDSSVSVVSEEVVMEESSGKNNNSIVDEHNKKSTYSLLYVKPQFFVKISSEENNNNNNNNEINDSDINDLSKRYSNSKINPNIIKYGKQHNEIFQKEIDEFERRRNIATETVFDKFKRLLIEKETRFQDTFNNDLSPPNLYSFHIFLESIDQKAHLQYEFADKVHRQLCANISLRENEDSEFRSAIAKDFPLIANINEISYQIPTYKDLYNNCIEVIAYTTEAMKLYRKQNYINSAMYLFHALVQENKINVHQAKRQAEVGEITRIVLVELSYHAKELLKQGFNNDSLEEFAIAGIVASQLITYHDMIMELKQIWESIEPEKCFRAIQYVGPLNKFYNTRIPMNMDLKAKEYRRRDNDMMWRKFLSQKAKFLAVVASKREIPPSESSS